MDNIPQLSFILGFDRSGTTMLRKILQKHPAIASTKETRFFSDFMSFRTALFTRRLKMSDIIFRESERIITAGNDITEAINKIKKAKTYKEWFLIVANYTAEKSEFETLIEKTPSHIYFTDYIKKWFPKAHFVYLVRDGREVCASCMKRWGNKKNYHLMIAARWMYANYFFLKKMDKDYIQVRYEDITLDPNKYLPKIFKHLGYEYNPSFIENIGISSSFSTYTNEGTISPSFNFNKYFDKKIRMEIEYFLSPLLKYFNYELEFGRYDISFSRKVIYRYEYIKVVIFWKMNRLGLGWIYKIYKKIQKVFINSENS